MGVSHRLDVSDSRKDDATGAALEGSADKIIAVSIAARSMAEGGEEMKAWTDRKQRARRRATK